MVEKINFDFLSFKEIKEIDIKHIRKTLEKNKNNIYWDTDYNCWIIYYQTAESFLLNECNTMINPKELIPEIYYIIENELKIKKPRCIADIQFTEDEIDNMIRDTLPDDDYFEMNEPGYYIDQMFGTIICEDYTRR